MTGSNRIKQACTQLAAILEYIAKDLRTTDHHEWASIQDMYWSTVNNIRHDFIEARPGMKGRVWEDLRK